MDFSRRRLLAQTAAGLAFSGYARMAAAQATPASVQAAPYTNQVAGYGPLKTDPAGLFDLPEGFSYTIVSRAGELMSDGLVTPRKTDGMGAFPLGRDKVALVRNHELKFGPDLDWGAFGVSQTLAGKVDKALVYDHMETGRALQGGTTTLVYDLRRKRLESSHLSLIGTSTNCAGGVTPWGSWLSCEEIVETPGAMKSHGWVFEVPSAHRGPVEPVPLKAMGRFRHEAACVDPRTGVVYLTEDEGGSTGDGLFYRYLPNARGELAKGGRLQALGFKDGGDANNWAGPEWAPGSSREVVWIDLDGVEAPGGDLRLRGRAKGAARFARGEGVFWSGEGLYFACTTGGPKKYGQIMRYRPSPHEGQAGEPGRLQLFVQSDDKAVMQMCDNIAVSPWGHLFACEDKEGGVNFLKAVTPEGKVYTVGRQAQTGDTDVSSNAELAGVCFSPDGSTLFLNVYWPGLTLAITGPWGAFRA
jgi:secreted PhoX family phosphatase